MIGSFLNPNVWIEPILSAGSKSVKDLKVETGGSWISFSRFIQERSDEAKHVAERKMKLVHADLLCYWIEPERTDIKSFCSRIRYTRCPMA
jgi:hypothetical protein